MGARRSLRLSSGRGDLLFFKVLFSEGDKKLMMDVNKFWVKDAIAA